ncbi:regulatory protein RecX [Aliiglaciecola sp. M165]|uniref:regulatory protein RecX n=1 Tax=Aliiglaciecola sp. M165 TaxID=2593649 RepID=UPI00163DBFED|nr:regulatory protein RecX [Aliiglaciecola sp. M165]
MADNDTKIINHSITRLLARREHSQQELIFKLSQKGFSEHAIRSQLRLFVEKDVQSDSRFVESFIRSKAQRGVGWQRIEKELQQHNIDQRLISEGLIEADIDFYQIAMQVYGKKYAKKPCKDWQEKQKRMRFLQYRGFNSDQIQHALKNQQDE